MLKESTSNQTKRLQTQNKENFIFTTPFIFVMGSGWDRDRDERKRLLKLSKFLFYKRDKKDIFLNEN